MANLDATSAAANWKTALSQAGAKAQAGAQRVSVSPGQKAAAQRQKYVNGVNDNVEKWARKVGAVSLADWQNAYTTKGVPRIASGAQAAEQKFAGALQPLFSYMSNGLGQIEAMDSSTPAGRDARMLAWAQYMRGYQAPG